MNQYSEAGVATERAKTALSASVNSKVCGNGRGSKFSFVVGQTGGESPADWSFPQSTMESSYVLGYYEYRIVSLCIQRSGNSLKWTAEVAIIDKMGWERKYDACWSWCFDLFHPDYSDPKRQRRQQDIDKPAFVDAMNMNTEQLFGTSREFERGKFTISGECCK